MLYSTFISVSLLIFALDRSTKSWILHHLSTNEPMGIFPPYFYITHITNTGAAFGILQDQRIFFIVITLVALAGIGIYFHRVHSENRVTSWGLTLVFGGAISNFYDRIFLGKVIDFLDIGTSRWRWPAFNIADIAICAGVVILMTQVLFEKPPPKEVERPDTPSSTESEIH